MTIGIRKEDPKRVWERRAPLTPEAVEQLVNGQPGGKAGDVRVEVESCARRCFSEADYRHVSPQHGRF
jgi:alpha-aminoadipic semialdehyde synthase